jgi:Flp pilus assembly protein TadB
MNEAVDEQSDGRLYFRCCKTVFQIFGLKGRRLAKLLASRDERIDALEEEFRLIERKHTSNEMRMEAKERSIAREKLRRKEIKFNSLKKRLKQEELSKALNFLGMPLMPYEVTFFAGFLAFISFVLGFISLMTVSAVLSGLEYLPIILPFVFILPIITYSIAHSYPQMLAKRMRASSIARTPEAINYMVMSMRLSPSLNKAVEFAAENTDEPVSSSLKKVLWNIYMKKHNNIEDAFLAFAFDWSDSEEFKNSLYAIRSASLEKTERGLIRALDKATEIVLIGTKRRIEGFVSSLTTPTTIMFSLGVLLPLVVGAMMPMLSLGSMNSGTILGQSGVVSDEPNPTGMILLMDVLFPIAGFLYAFNILGKRPGTSVPLDIRSDMHKGQLNNMMLTLFLIAVGLVICGILIILSYNNILGSFLLLWGIGLPLALYYMLTVSNRKRKRDKILRMEEQLPDAIFQLGSRIAEGIPVEKALKKTSDTMKDTDISELFEQIYFRIQITRTTLEDALFGFDGLLNEFPSKSISATLKVAVEVTKKDAHEAGQTLISISNYLRDMKSLEHEIRTSLKSSVDGMKATGMIFAPLVMGVTSGLFFLLSGVFESLGSGAQMIPSPIFVLIVGIYLILTVIIIMYFTTGIEHGADPIERRYQTGIALVVALLIFTVTTVAANAGLAA